MNVLAGLRGFAGWTLARLLRASGALRRARRGLVQQNAILVLTLHRVLSADERGRAFSEPGMVLSRDNFHALMDYLASHYDVVRLADLAAGAWPEPSTRPRVAITFDDGWQDNFAPVLAEARRRATPLTIFACSDLVGKPSPFWPEHVQALMAGASQAERHSSISRLKSLAKPERSAAIEQLARSSGPAADAGDNSADATMSWEALRELQSAGVDIESHAKSHEILTTLSAEEAGRELAESRQVLNGELGRDCRLVAYPNGNHSALVRQLARQAGFHLGCAVAEGLWTSSTDRMAIPRVNICDSRVSEFDGGFSAVRFEYAVVFRAWKAWKASARMIGQPGSVAEAAAGRAVREVNK